MSLAAKNAKCAKEAWPMVRLGDVCEKKIKRLRQINDEEFEYIDISSIDRKTKSIISTKECQRGDAPGRAQQVVDEGDVLVSTVRPNLNAVAVVGKKQKLQRIASTGFCVLRPSANILSEYIFYCVQHDEFIAALVGVAEKAAYPSVTDDEVKSVSIPLPPLPAQREIVARLEKELGEADALAAKFKEIAENADAEFKAELDETFKNVEGEKVRLGDVCDIRAGGDKPSFFSPTITKECSVPVVANAVENDGVCGYTNEAQIDKQCITISARGTIGFVCLRLAPFYPIVRLVSVIPHESINLKYLYYIALTIPVKHTGVSIPQLTVPKVKEYHINVPSAIVQKSIVNKLDTATAKCEKVKAAAERGLRAAEDLRKAILSEAFEQ